MLRAPPAGFIRHRLYRKALSGIRTRTARHKRISGGGSTSLAVTDSHTSREQDVLRLLATGASNHEITQSLVISLATVKKHVSNVLGKLGATSRTQAIVEARLLALL